MSDLKSIIKLAAQAVIFRSGDVTTEDGYYATTDCDIMINLDSTIAEYFNLDSDDVTTGNFNELICKIDSLPDIEQLQQRNAELAATVERLRRAIEYCTQHTLLKTN